MARIGFSSNLLRPESGEVARRVTFTELFFDLVFVFAVTQEKRMPPLSCAERERGTPE